MGQKTAPSQTQTTNSQMSAGQEQEWNSGLQNLNSTINQDIGSVNYGQLQGQLGQNAQNIEGQQVNAAGIAAPIAAAGQTSWATPGTAQQFMSPYENTALQNQVNLATQTELNPQLAQQQASAAASGALGGSRSALQEGLTTQNFDQNMNSMIAQGENQAYNTGEQTFEQEQARNLQGQTAAAQTNLAGVNSNVYANLAASQPLMQQIQASEAPGQQEMQGIQALGMQPKEGTQTTTQVSSPGTGGILGDISGVLGGAAQLGLGIATGGASGALSSLQNMNTPGKAAGGLVGAGKRPTANPAFGEPAPYKKGGKITKKQVKKGKN